MVISQEFADLLATYIDDRYITPSLGNRYSEGTSYIAANLSESNKYLLRDGYHTPSEFDIFIKLTRNNKIESLNGVSNLDFSKLEESLKNSLISTLKREIKKRVVTQGSPTADEEGD